jgi:hypothetical protein
LPSIVARQAKRAASAFGDFMMTIDEEIQHLIHFLSRGADYTVSIGTISIASICADDECWVVNWREEDEGIILECQKDFVSLFDASQFFVEKRRYMCIGADFDQLRESKDEQEE